MVKSPSPRRLPERYHRSRIKRVNYEIEDQKAQEGFKLKPVPALREPVFARPHTAVYKMHRFYARRPHNVFARLIEHYSAPGDIILDPFCGGGVTVVEALKLRRKVIGVDLNPLATFVTEMEVTSVDLGGLEKAFESLHRLIEKKILPLYRTTCPKCGCEDAIADWYEWSKVVKCPGLCRKDVVLAEAEKVRAGLYRCPNCQAHIKPTECRRRLDVMLGLHYQCPSCESSGDKRALSEDVALAARIRRSLSRRVNSEGLFIPDDPFPDADRQRDDAVFQKGIKRFADFFTRRNLLANARLRKLITKAKFPPTISKLVLLCYSSALSYTSKLSVMWGGENPREWRAHAYWLPYTYVDFNVVRAFRKRTTALLRGKRNSQDEIADYCVFANEFKEVQDGGTCMLLTQSSHDLPLPDNSVDVIITDPPFGGNVQYAELSDFYVVWLREVVGCDGLIDNSLEAIETRHQGFPSAKNEHHYEDMLYRIFKECHRVLKKDGWMVLTFHNREQRVWFALHSAANRAGFKLPAREEEINRGMVYQPPIQAYTPTFHQRAAGSMLGDFILSFKRLDISPELGEIRDGLTRPEEQEIIDLIEQVIIRNGGADEALICATVIPYLHERNSFFRVAGYDFRTLLKSADFKFDKETKKWYTADMIGEHNKPLRLIEATEAERAVEEIVSDLLRREGSADMDQILVAIYTTLVNHDIPGLESVSKALNRLCDQRRDRKLKREVYVLKKKWLAKPPPPQPALFGEEGRKHEEIILQLAQEATSRGLDVHAGKSEQRKHKALRQISTPLRGYTDYGLTKEAVRTIQEIDLLVLKGRVILSAVEVATTIETLDKAVNNRFRNLLTLCPNLKIKLVAVVRDSDVNKAHEIVSTPANIEAGLSRAVRIVPLSQLDRSQLHDTIFMPLRGS